VIEEELYAMMPWWQLVAFGETATWSADPLSFDKIFLNLSKDAIEGSEVFRDTVISSGTSLIPLYSRLESTIVSLKSAKENPNNIAPYVSQHSVEIKMMKF
jgi:hypothetical protein